MINDKITDTCETLAKDTDHLRKDARKIIEDVKKHANAHVDVVKVQVKNTFDLARDFVKERPLHFGAVAFFIGFLIGTFRRKYPTWIRTMNLAASTRPFFSIFPCRETNVKPWTTLQLFSNKAWPKWYNSRGTI